MGNETKTSHSIVFGALASLILWAATPALRAHGLDVTPEISGAFVTVFVAAAGFVTPPNLGQRPDPPAPGGAP